MAGIEPAAYRVRLYDCALYRSFRVRLFPHLPRIPYSATFQPLDFRMANRQMARDPMHSVR